MLCVFVCTEHTVGHTFSVWWCVYAFTHALSCMYECIYIYIYICQVSVGVCSYLCVLVHTKSKPEHILISTFKLKHLSSLFVEAQGGSTLPCCLVQLFLSVCLAHCCSPTCLSLWSILYLSQHVYYLFLQSIFITLSFIPFIISCLVHCLWFVVIGWQLPPITFVVPQHFFWFVSVYCFTFITASTLYQYQHHRYHHKK